MNRLSFLGALVVAAPLFSLACSAEPEAKSDSDIFSKCEADETESCECKSGASGTKTCSSKGKWSSCDCSDDSSSSSSSTETPPATTAGTCSELRSCTNMQSAPGTFSPQPGLNVGLQARTKAQAFEAFREEVAAGSARARNLAAALGAPVAGEPKEVSILRDVLAASPKVKANLSSHVGELGFGNLDVYRNNFPATVPAVSHPVLDATASTCSPSLRIRLAKITVHEDEDDTANDEIYCSISASTAAVQELRVTPKTRALDEGEFQAFTGDESIIFGQGKPREAKGDITLKYDCFEAESDDGYNQLIQQASSAAAKYGGQVVSDEYSGYVSEGADLIGTYGPLLAGLDSDDHLFVAQQIIPVATQMEIAKAGGTWTIKKSGSNNWSDWEWSLTMEAWGCSVNGSK